MFMPKVTMRGGRKNSPKVGFIRGVIGSKKGFTLPEVIVSFSILAMVITSAVGLLTVVIRTNSDNVNSLVANGLAQEGIEAVRFMRDSNHILGLDFNGEKGTGDSRMWGAKMFDDMAGGVKYFKLVSNFEPMVDCTTANLTDCLPVQFVGVDGVSDETLDALANNVDARVYFQKTGDDVVDGENAPTVDFQYLQLESNDIQGEDLRPTQYSRVIRIEPLKSNTSVYDVLRVSSIVAWTDNNNLPKRLVLTTDLTDWQ